MAQAGRDYLDIMQPDLTFRTLWRSYRRERFRSELVSDWAVAVLYRLPSLWLVARLAPTGISPTAVTLAAFPLALAMPLAALLLPLGFAALATVLLAVAFQILDCVDGGLARATGRSSSKGAALDFVIDMAQWGLFYTSIGIVADRMAGTGEGTGLFWTVVAVAAAWLRLYARVVRDARPASAAPDTPAATAPVEPAGQGGLVVLAERAVAGMSGALPIFFGIAALAGAVPAMVIFVLLYALLDVGDAVWTSFRNWPGEAA
ncbi:CDP-alcohol phosphatidyltransferase family protein [Stappia sp. 28M-7]|uniref:CDP-alcohol phosphatidyltransferase family protein n=1 Tax=Stappia sp. 28M-7 TaxID=2762596 RepID=UPI00163C607C|nr:CDP-alcohol phosphatidyltransferase family protein [Stappia sp. 28M-7]MBC2860992.1 CDP-alcohol phosphatidyltransferase family protein [Stappia sp. 28M-7]